MLKCQIKINNKKDLNIFIDKLIKNISFPCCICLNGPLGSGKTYFSKRFINKICGKNMNVNSPTFNLVNIYDIPKTKKLTSSQIWHFDLYRISDEAELLELGIEEALKNHITIIEWANKLEDLYPKNSLTIDLELNTDNTRILRLSNNKLCD